MTRRADDLVRAAVTTGGDADRYAAGLKVLRGGPLSFTPTGSVPTRATSRLERFNP